MAGSLPPLPSDLRQLVEKSLGGQVLAREGNAGLVWERYAALWTGETPRPLKNEEQAKWLKSFADAYAALKGTQQPLLEARHRRLDACFQCIGNYKTVGRLVTGLGAAHPTENGFSFDRNLGVPVLSGSAVKGLCRAGARLVGAPEGEWEPLFGPERKEEEESAAGSVVFAGALPKLWPRLEVEILNPHHFSYYQDQGQPLRDRKKLAVLSEDPRPVTFLTVGSGVVFRFWFGARGRQPLLPQHQEQVRQWLTVGLEALGIGAKTAGGYGHMVRM